MGKAMRWLKGLFSFKKENDQSNSGSRRDKTTSCIGRSRRDSSTSPPEPPFLKPLYSNNSMEQNKHAIAVAAATAAAADAAVAAAQAAVAFVRLTSYNRVTVRENSAAIKIQALFRGYLSRKALKALKSLVKLQAVVRGYLVRKEAAETLHGMEALCRAQSTVCAHRFRLQDDKFHSRRSTKRANEARSRRISTSFQAHGRPSPIEFDPEYQAKTWAWGPDSGAQTPNFSNPHHLSTPSLPNHHVFDYGFSTTHNTPRFSYSCGPNIYDSVYDKVSKDDSFASHPGYMANTKSFRAKVRSHSAPKQRPDYGFGFKKRVGLNEVEFGARVEKEKSKSKSPSLLEVNNFKNFVMGRIGKSSKVQWG
ncbi:protein IQ-domain 26 [Lactuca sativa]|uniref:DUF4005 domain-containing protein n=1 Tax=Lactuca sativa TaxID=4236 RepID=A0A9R1VDQ5_LACSA|nr:protein IQ-domain 26 [Lactuca sativa]KAJ0202890.1 hypothetical protein LSAT_V11C500281450 [Lactuca sativa]